MDMGPSGLEGSYDTGFVVFLVEKLKTYLGSHIPSWIL